MVSLGTYIEQTLLRQAFLPETVCDITIQKRLLTLGQNRRTFISLSELNTAQNPISEGSMTPPDRTKRRAIPHNPHR
jgi:hypothetical protein